MIRTTNGSSRRRTGRAAAALLCSLAVMASSAPPASAAATWRAEVTLGESGAEPINPAVASSADGSTLVAVWQESVEEFIGQVYARVASMKGTKITWGPAVEIPLEVYSGPVAFNELDVEVSADGRRALVVGAGGVGVVVAASGRLRFGADTGPDSVWGDSAILGAGQRPRAALADDGTRAIVSWEGVPLTSTFVTESVSVAAGVLDGTSALWGAPTLVCTAPDSGTEFCRDFGIVVSDDVERATVVWTGSTQVKARSGRIDGTSSSWGAESVVGDVVIPNPGTVSVAGSSSAQTLAVGWTGTASSGSAAGPFRVRIGTVTGDSATWGAVSDVSAGASARTATLDMSADGTRVAAAWQAGTTPLRTRVASIAGGTATWGAVSSPPGEVGTLPVLSMSADGTRALLSYTRATGTNLESVVTTGSTRTSTPTWVSPAQVLLTVPTSLVVGSIDWTIPTVLSGSGARGIALYPGVGSSPEVGVVKARTVVDPGSPAPPSLDRLERGDGSVRVVINARGDDGGANILRHEARCVSGDDTVTKRDSDRDIRVTGLTNFQDWECSARWSNSYGWSPWSDSRSIWLSNKPVTRPGTPEIGRILGGDRAAAVVLRRVERPGGSTLTGFRARCTNGGTTRTSAVAPGRSLLVVGLTNDVVWECAGQVRNSEGWSDWSEERTVTPTGPEPVS